MPIIVLTQNPTRLLAAIKTDILDGSIETWGCDDDGDFVYTTEQWQEAGCLSPTVSENALDLDWIDGPHREEYIEEAAAYGSLHGLFVGMLLRRFSSDIVGITVTPFAPGA